MYVIRELEDAVYDCEQGCTTEDCNDDKVHALDEAVAFYTGSLVGPDGDEDGFFMYSLAEKRAGELKTGGSNGDNLEGTAKVNIDIFRNFKNMQAKLVQNDCKGARVYREAIAELIFVPFIQGALRYAYLQATDPDITNKREAEGVLFASAVVPLVASCSEGDAQIIHEKMQPGMPNTMDDFYEIKTAFEKNYGCMKISCRDVGGIWDEASGNYFEGTSPCTHTEGSQVNVGLAVGLSVGLFAVLALVLSYCFCCRSRGDDGSNVEFKSGDGPVA